MNTRDAACDDLLRSRQRGVAPFSRGIILDWYDGPVTGALQCGAAPEVYAFHMVAWDDRQRSRIYALRRLPADAFARLLRALASAGEPRWPWWAPMRFPSEADREQAWAGADEILEKAGNVEYIILSDDIFSSVERVRTVGDEEQPRIQTLIRSSPSDADGYTYSEATFDEWLAVVQESV